MQSLLNFSFIKRNEEWAFFYVFNATLGTYNTLLHSFRGFCMAETYLKRENKANIVFKWDSRDNMQIKPLKVRVNELKLKV